MNGFGHYTLRRSTGMYFINDWAYRLVFTNPFVYVLKDANYILHLLALKFLYYINDKWKTLKEKINIDLMIVIFD